MSDSPDRKPLTVGKIEFDDQSTRVVSGLPRSDGHLHISPAFLDAIVEGLRERGLLERPAKEADLVKPSWISVKERLPEMGQTVVWADFDFLETIYWVSNAYGKQSTHWMPLPGPPEG